MGRKALPESVRRGDWLHIRLTHAERARLEEHAATRGLPITDVVRAELGPILADVIEAQAPARGQGAQLGQANQILTAR